eukprot:gene11179-18792_t
MATALASEPVLSLADVKRRVTVAEGMFTGLLQHVHGQQGLPAVSAAYWGCLLGDQWGGLFWGGLLGVQQGLPAGIGGSTGGPNVCTLGPTGWPWASGFLLEFIGAIVGGPLGPMLATWWPNLVHGGFLVFLLEFNRGFGGGPTWGPMWSTWGLMEVQWGLLGGLWEFQ